LSKRERCEMIELFRDEYKRYMEKTPNERGDERRKIGFI
jgi:hypothetical protein